MRPAVQEEEIRIIEKFDDQPYILKKFEKPGEISLYYGFMPIKTPKLGQVDRKNAKSLVETSTTNVRRRSSLNQKEYELGLRPEEKCALFRNLIKEDLDNLTQPHGFYYTLPLTGDTRSKIRGQQHALDIVNSRQPIADATIIKTALEILKEEGHSDTQVIINSVGDDQSKTRYRRELIEYFKTHKSELPKSAQSLIKDNVFMLMHHDHKDVIALAENAPNALDFLDEESRTRFMSVLEFLETLGISYEINPTLVGDIYFEHSIFEIRRSPNKINTKGELLARGGCYANIAKKSGARKDLPSIGITINYTRTNKKTKTIFTLTRVDKPVCYFMQLGPMAKLKSLHIIENLRQANVPLRHALCSEKCHGQMAVAQKISLPYLIIMGQKEALEDAVVIRDMTTFAQTVVPTKELAEHMKKLVRK